MSEPRYFLVEAPGVSAEEVTRFTGREAHYSPLGMLVDARSLPNVQRMMEQVDRALHPRRCTCGAWAILHRPGCPEYGAIS